jgi:hypothetical protein
LAVYLDGLFNVAIASCVLDGDKWRNYTSQGINLQIAAHMIRQFIGGVKLQKSYSLWLGIEGNVYVFRNDKLGVPIFANIQSVVEFAHSLFGATVV